MKFSSTRSFKKQMKPGPKAFISLCLAFCLIITGIVPAFSVFAAQPEGTDPVLQNLIIDKVYSLEPIGTIPDGAVQTISGFTPEVTEYNGIAYASVEAVKVYPFTNSATAHVKVNGTPLTDSFVTLDISKVGKHDITIDVADNGSSKKYIIHVEKRDTDYRGRRSITKNDTILNALSVKSNPAMQVNDAELLKILKKDYLVMVNPTPGQNIHVGSSGYENTSESYCQFPSSLLKGSSDENPVELFTVDLGDVYQVSRIRAAFGPKNLPLGGNISQIEVSADGKSWQKPVFHGNMNTGESFHQNVVRYELGNTYSTRYIRFLVSKYSMDLDLRIYQFMIYTDDVLDSPPILPAPKDGFIPYQHSEEHKYLSNGQSTVIERGYPLLGWMPSQGYGRGVSTPEEQALFGFDGPLFYDAYNGFLQNKDYMNWNPNSLWGLAKAPNGVNSVGGECFDFIAPEMKPYIRNAVSFCFGDESWYNRDEAIAYGKWYDFIRERYPSVIVHNNQFFNQWSIPQVREYMQLSRPDMLTWDDYYGDGRYNGSSFDLSRDDIQKDAARHLLSPKRYMEPYRQLAWEGIDGTGTKPILWGQYLDSSGINHSESNKNLIANLSAAAGAKWLNFFRLEYQFSWAYTWDEDGTPTLGLLEWAPINARLHAIDNQLCRLNNDWIMFKIGEMGEINANKPVDGFRRGNFDDPKSTAKNREFGIQNITMKSLSNAHNKKTGDVILSYFKPLPGLYGTETAQYFEGATDPRAFIVLNGLVAGKAEYYEDSFKPDRQNALALREEGSCLNTRQEITVTATDEFKGKKLYMVDKDNNGKIVEVPLDQNGSFTVTLGGGEMNLYFWGTDSTAVSSPKAAHGADAAFAFDGHPQTFWQPSNSADNYTLEKAFTSCQLNGITVTEKGSAVTDMTASYQTADGNWTSLGALTGNNGIWTLNLESPLSSITGIRLEMTAADVPSIYQIDLDSTAADPEALNILTVNDNELGDGLFRFDYSPDWSYREAENDNGGLAAYPIKGDGHFSNYTGSTSTFKMYGVKADVHFRDQSPNAVQIEVLDQNGTVLETKTNSSPAVSFDMTTRNNGENGLYTIRLTKTNNNQAGIDGIDVFYKGEIPQDVIKANSQGPKAIQEYLNDNSPAFSFEPSDPIQIAGSASGLPINSAESTQWVKTNQDLNYNNVGITRTKAENASYTLTFNGTGVHLYSGANVPAEGNKYGTLQFILDGQDITEKMQPYTVDKANPNISVNRWTISDLENTTHTLKVTSTGGFNRIDYAVVEKPYTQDVAPKHQTIDVKVSNPDHGSASADPAVVEKDGNSIVSISPAEGYAVSKILVNGKSVPIPADNRLVLTQITENQEVMVTFDVAKYTVNLQNDAANGGFIAANILYPRANETVVLTAHPLTGYHLVDGSVNVQAADGTSVEVTSSDAGYVFTMPNSDVTVTAEFLADEHTITVTSPENGNLTTDPANKAFFGSTVSINATPAEGFKRTALSITYGENQSIVPAATEDPNVFTFTMPDADVTVSAVFDAIPSHDIIVTVNGEGGTASAQTSPVAEGSAAIIDIVPDEGFKVASITVNDSVVGIPADNRLVIENVTETKNVVITFEEIPPVTYTISAAVSGEGGTVTPDSQSVNEGSNAVLTIIPSENFHVESITDGTTSYLDKLTGTTLTIENVTGDLALTITFAKDQYTVIAGATENGTLSFDVSQAGVGDTVTVTVTPNNDFVLDTISASVNDQDVSLTTVEIGTTYTFIMPAGNVIVNAVFKAAGPEVPDLYNVTVNESSAQDNGSGSYEAGTVVTIAAGSKEGFIFAGWSVSPETVQLADAAQPTTTFTMPAEAVAVTANWKPIPSYTVSVNGVHEHGEGSYKEGDLVTLSAGTNAGHTFAGWTVDSGNVTILNAQNNTVTFIMPAGNVTVTANWKVIPAPPKYNVTVEESFAQNSGAGTYKEGDTVTLSAGSRSDDFHFTGWTVVSGNVKLANAGSANTSFQMPAEDVNIKANWAKNKPVPPTPSEKPDVPETDPIQPTENPQPTEQPAPQPTNAPNSTTAPAQPTQSNAVVTGDTSYLWTWIGLMLVCGTILIALYVVKKGRKD